MKKLAGLAAVMIFIISAIGFTGSYRSVQHLAVTQHFGFFSYVFPIGIDAGIVALLALDLVLTALRMPFPMLRQGAWLLTAATIAFNAASGWPANTPVSIGSLWAHGLGVVMHGIIPVLFVLAVEAARHAVGRSADITADQHMEGVRLTRWILSPVPTFRLWRRMKLWEIRSYEQIVQMEQRRLVYRAILRREYGRNWRRKAPLDVLLPLRLARVGRDLPELALPETPLLAKYAVKSEPVELSSPDVLPVLESVEREAVRALVESPAVSAEPLQHPSPLEPVEQRAAAVEAFAAPVEQRAEPVEQQSFYPDGQLDRGELEFPAAGEGGGAGAPAPMPAASYDWRPPVQARIPAQAQESYPPAAVAPVDGELWAESEPELQVTGKRGLIPLWESLSDDQKQLSAQELAVILAPKLGLSVGSCRKYIGDLRAGRLVRSDA